MSRRRVLSGLAVCILSSALICSVALGQDTSTATPAATPLPPAGLVGCYAILDSTRRLADNAWYNVMSLVRLTDVPQRGYDGNVQLHVWHLRPLSNAGHGRFRADPLGNLERVAGFTPSWGVNRSGDSVAFSFRDGFSGAVMKFARGDARDDTLRGRVTETWDSGPPFSNDGGLAYAVRRPCP